VAKRKHKGGKKGRGKSSRRTGLGVKKYCPLGNVRGKVLQIATGRIQGKSGGRRARIGTTKKVTRERHTGVEKGDAGDKEWEKLTKQRKEKRKKDET